LKRYKMLAAKMCGVVRNGAGLLRSGVGAGQLRVYSQDARGAFSRQAARRKTVKESAMAPASGSAINAGQGALAGAAVLGLGGLAFYGLGFSGELGAVDKQVMWPQYVKERIRDTYMYFGGSIIITAASAAAVFRSPAAMNIVMRQGWVALGVSIAAMIGSGMLARSIPYQGAPSAKQAAWMLHCAVIGAVIAPICLLGGPILTRAAWYTAGMVGGLSTVAGCAPSDKFLTWGGPLAMGLGVVFCASIGTMFLPPTTVLGSGLYSVAVYGGLILFGAFLLYDTQKIIHKAERHPVGYGVAPFDPVNASIGIYMDTINIFIRIATILGMGGNRRK
jgi:FtsH-binding integral membrane protein